MSWYFFIFGWDDENIKGLKSTVVSIPYISKVNYFGFRGSSKEKVESYVPIFLSKSNLTNFHFSFDTIINKITGVYHANNSSTNSRQLYYKFL